MKRAAAFGLLVLTLSLTGWASSPSVVAQPAKANVAFYYQADLPVDMLQAFDQVVIDPAVAKLPPAAKTLHTEWVARVSMDRTDAEAAAQWLQHRIEPLWSQGYRAFYLDDDQPLEATIAATDPMGERLALLKSRYPDVHILLHNHPELLPTWGSKLSGWVVDSVFRHYDPVAGSFLTVPDAARQAMLTRLAGWQKRYPELNVIDLETCMDNDLACRRDIARQSHLAGLTPYVTDAHMASVGVGRIEVMPRRVLVVQSLPRGEPAEEGTGARVLSMPLDYLGYDIQFANVNEGLPENITPDRYAGVVAYFDSDAAQTEMWKSWFLRCMDRGLPVAFFDQFGFDLDPHVATRLGVTLVGGQYPVGSKAEIVNIDPMMGFERNPHLDLQDKMGLENAINIRLKDPRQSLARIRVANETIDMAGITNWGGYTLAPFSMEYLPELDQDYWVVNPLLFIKQALRLPEMPVPDVTTENGRRLMFVQIDGDGFASRAEFSGPDYGAEALYDRVLKVYPVPTTVSVIEGEVAADGKYPQLSPKLEAIARQVFALPNVEIGSHGYAHPLDWVLADPQYHEEEEHISLHIPGYHFSVDREIRGSIDYINRRLAPPGKKVKVMQWTGEANPTAQALQKAYEVGVYNINGGDTVITNSDNSWTEIGGMGIAKGEGDENYQVYAAEMNENIYTHDWIRPFYGMVRVLETFHLTEMPLRLKPVDIYYHFYSGTKLASLKALINVYDVTLRQPVFPIYTSEYVERVLEARHAAVARDGEDWFIRTGPALREFRLPEGEVPDLAQAQGLIGYLPTHGGAYVHLDQDQARFSVMPPGPAPMPYVAAAAAFIDQVRRDGHTLSLQTWGYYQPYVVFQNAAACAFRLDGQTQVPSLDPKRRAVIRFAGDVTGQTRHTIEVQCE